MQFHPSFFSVLQNEDKETAKLDQGKSAENFHLVSWNLLCVLVASILENICYQANRE
jgi:hypothetical protein